MPETQRLLVDRTGLISEYVVTTAGARHLADGVPNSYKLDLAHPQRLIAVEIDGRSHNTRIARIRDAKKDLVLCGLGWKVMRFANADVLERADDIAALILAECGAYRAVAEPRLDTIIGRTK